MTLRRLTALESSGEIKEILIRHELSHIRRKDNLIGWVSLIFRDLNFFNPFGYIAYYLIRSEQEKACDGLVAKSDERPSEEMGGRDDAGRW